MNTQMHKMAEAVATLGQVRNGRNTGAEVQGFMALRNIHIRMSEEQYDFVQALAQGLNCSQAEVIRRAIFDTDMKEIVAAYRDQKVSQPLAKFFAYGMDDDSKKRMEILGQELNENTQQIRRIGTNVSTMIRDIRNGKVNWRNGSDRLWIETIFNQLLKANKDAMEKQQALAEMMADLMDNIEFKLQYRKG